MNKYSKFKHSKVDWIGKIPAHWNLAKPKYKLNRITRSVDEDDEVITCFRDGVVTLRKNRRLEGYTVSVKEHGYQQILPDDLVIHQMDGFAGAIGISDSKGKSSPVYTVIEPDGRTDLKYVKSLLNEMAVSGKIASLAKSIRERTTEFKWDIWSATKFPFPPVQEQRVISSFVDTTSDRIALLISKIQQKIELLKEQRKSLISKCITKGLDSSIELKDSGVEWIGRIPSHWKVRKLKYLAQRIIEKRFPLSGDIKISSENVESHTGKVLDFYSNYQTEGQLFQNGDILFNKLGVYLNKVVLCDFVGLSMSEMIVLRSFGIQEGFLHKVLTSIKFIEHIDSDSRGVKLPRPPVESIMNAYVTVPPLEEQVIIRQYLDRKLDTIDRLVRCHHKHVELYREYRQSLISSAVTGKIKITEDMI